MVDLEALARAWLEVGTALNKDTLTYRVALDKARRIEAEAESYGVRYVARPDDPRSWPDYPFTMVWAPRRRSQSHFWTRDRGDFSPSGF